MTARRLASRALRALTVLSVLMVAGCSGPPVGEGRPAQLAGVDLDGAQWDIADLAGETVIVTVWASWCAPCRDEVPVLERALEHLAADGLRVLGVNFRDNPLAAVQFVEQEGLAYPSIVDPDGQHSVEWGVSGIPQSFLVDRDGMVVDRVVGVVTDDWIDTVVVEELRR